MKMVPLGELVDILDNLRVPINSSERSNRLGSIPYYGATGQVGTIDKAIFDETLILLGEDGAPFFDPSKHKAYEISGPSWVNNHAHVLRAKPDLIVQRYLLHYLNGFNYSGYVNGATRLKLTQKDMRRIPVPLPSLETQREIVGKLDNALFEIDNEISISSQSLVNLANLLDSKLEEVFTSLIENCGTVISGSIIDVRDGTHDSPSYVESGYPLITSKNLQKGLIDFSKVSYINKDDYNSINKRSKVDIGDLLFAMIGTIGNPVVVRDKPIFAIKNVALFKANPDYDMTFLSYYLKAPKIKDRFERDAKGTTQRFLGLGYLRSLDVPNVKIGEQLKFVKEFNQFENAIKNYELQLNRRLVLLEDLKNSIIFHAFTLEKAVA